MRVDSVIISLVLLFLQQRDVSVTSHVLQGVRRHHRSAVQFDSDEYTIRGGGRTHGSSVGLLELHYVISDAARLDQKYPPEILHTIRFRFLNQPTTGNTLSVNNTTGRLTTIGRIDRETLCAELTSSTGSRNDMCKLRFDVALQPAQFFQIIRIVVEILDVNDNSPQFSAGFRHHELLETALLGITNSY
jgi:Cadherin-like